MPPNPELLGSFTHIDRPLEESVGVLADGLNADELPALIPQPVEGFLDSGVSAIGHEVVSLQLVGPDDHAQILPLGHLDWKWARAPDRRWEKEAQSPVAFLRGFRLD